MPEQQLTLPLAAMAPQAFCNWMRNQARSIAMKGDGTVCIDDLREYAAKRNIWPDVPNAWGGVFLSSDFEPCGYKRSRLKSNNGRRVTIWRLVTKPDDA